MAGFEVTINGRFWVTAEDRFLKRAKAVNTGQTKVVSPLELVTEVTMNVQTRPFK